MKTCSERNEQRINSLQLSESLEDEIKELDGKNVEAGDVIFTTDTSSFLTIVCCSFLSEHVFIFSPPLIIKIIPYF